MVPSASLGKCELIGSRAGYKVPDLLAVPPGVRSEIATPKGADSKASMRVLAPHELAQVENRRQPERLHSVLSIVKLSFTACKSTSRIYLLGIPTRPDPSAPSGSGLYPSPDCLQSA